MPSVVSDKCVKCYSCVQVCPVDAFHEDDKMLVVSPDDCIDCGICLSECPEAAITQSDDADPKWVAYNAEKAPNLPKASK